MAQTARQELTGASPVVTVAGGLVGLPRLRRFTLERGADPTAPFHLLVGLDGTGACLVVCDAAVLWPDYAAEVRAVATADPACAVLAIVNARGAVAANLLAPLIVDPTTGAARQLVLEGSSWAVRHPL